MALSKFLSARRQYQPRIPQVLSDLRSVIGIGMHSNMSESLDSVVLKEHFPRGYGKAAIKLKNSQNQVEKSLLSVTARMQKIGVVFSGGPAPGGHNVVAGLFHGMRQLDADSELVGFLGGPGGILKQNFQVLDQTTIDGYLNSGGFGLLGTGRTKIETLEDFRRCEAVLAKMDLDGLCIIGGDDSNTNACLLAEYLESVNSKTRVVGVPKTIDGDLRNEFLQISFGFDTAVRVYSELVSNISSDVLSTKKYYHFIRLMGRAASHITLEVGLQTQPNIILVSEEIAKKNLCLQDLIDDLARVVLERSAKGLNYGIVLVPEGLIEFIPEVKVLIAELNQVLSDHAAHIFGLNEFAQILEFVSHKLSKDASYTFSGLPLDIQSQLLMDRDPHGNVVVSLIETEKLLIELLESRLAELKSSGKYSGNFAYQRHFFGYEGRCAAPSNFDANYAFSLGINAAALLGLGCNGYLSVINDLTKPPSDWKAVGIPLVQLLSMARRHGKIKPVIRRAEVDIEGPIFAFLQRHRLLWEKNDCYNFVGPIQYFGPGDLVDQPPMFLEL